MSARQQAEQGTRQVAESSPVKLLGRVGLVAYGVVHLLIAYLAIRVAIGDGGGKLNKSGALQTVAAQPGGRFLLWTVAVGMVALAVWQAAEAIWGHRYRHGRRRTLKKAASAGEALVAAALGISAGRLAAGEPKSSQSTELTAQVLELPGGPFLVGLAGLGIVGIAGYLVYYGVKKRFTEDLDLSGADHKARRSAIRLGQIGWPALGVAYGIVGALVIVAAMTYDPEKAAGLDTGLKTLAAQAYGTVLLGVVAAGLACFGLYCLLDARYRRA